MLPNQSIRTTAVNLISRKSAVSYVVSSKVVDPRTSQSSGKKTKAAAHRYNSATGSDLASCSLYRGLEAPMKGLSVSMTAQILQS